MVTSPEELESYVKIMRSLGVRVFKTGNLEIELGAAPAPPVSRPDPDAPKPAPKRHDYDRLLFAATEGIAEDDDE